MAKPTREADYFESMAAAGTPKFSKVTEIKPAKTKQKAKAQAPAPKTEKKPKKAKAAPAKPQPAPKTKPASPRAGTEAISVSKFRDLGGEVKRHRWAWVEGKERVEAKCLRDGCKARQHFQAGRMGGLFRYYTVHGSKDQMLRIPPCPLTSK